MHTHIYNKLTSGYPKYFEAVLIFFLIFTALISHTRSTISHCTYYSCSHVASCQIQQINFPRADPDFPRKQKRFCAPPCRTYAPTVFTSKRQKQITFHTRVQICTPDTCARARSNQLLNVFVHHCGYSEFL